MIGGEPLGTSSLSAPILVVCELIFLKATMMAPTKRGQPKIATSTTKEAINVICILNSASGCVSGNIICSSDVELGKTKSGKGVTGGCGAS